MCDNCTAKDANQLAGPTSHSQIRRSTLREQLVWRKNDLEYQLKDIQERLDHTNKTLAKLTKNKELETLVDLLRE